MSPVARRQLLTLLAAAPAASFGIGRPVDAATWTRLFHDLESARLIGRTVLESHPDLGPGEAIRSRLRQRHAVFRELLADTAERPASAVLAPAMAEAIAADFAAHHTLTVAGWVLSRSEAELCALVYLA